MILTPILKLPRNREDWDKLIVAKGFKNLPKIQNIAQSGHAVPVTIFKFGPVNICYQNICQIGLKFSQPHFRPLKFTSFNLSAL